MKTNCLGQKSGQSCELRRAFLCAAIRADYGHLLNLERYLVGVVFCENPRKARRHAEGAI